MSTPLFIHQKQHTDLKTEKRHRRHTIITRPDSSMGLLSEDEEEQETFDRISGILSSLIQEANQAVQSTPKGKERMKRVPTPSRIFTSSTVISQTSESSKIPRPSNRRSSKTSLSGHVRNMSSSSSSSTNSTNGALFSPISTTSTSATSISRSPSPTMSTFSKKQQQQFRNQHHHHSHNQVLRPRSCPVIQPPNRRSSITPINRKKIDPITESFKRLDSSMALVDSLSRDLAATTNNQQPTTTNSTLLLLLVPLLHIPHSLITMMFDFCSSNSSGVGAAGAAGAGVQLMRSNSSAFSFSSMIFWACVFAVTNLMVDQVAVIPKRYLNITTKKMKGSSVRRMSLPGAFTTGANTVIKKKTSKVPNSKKIKQASVPVKRTWIPATAQQQYQFRLTGEQIPQPQKRRNSI
jgi:hypothetical protein